MKRIGLFGVIPAIALIAGIAYYTFYSNTQSDGELNLGAGVEAIITAPQTYDGEHIERLVGLGPSAIKPIGEKLVSGYEYPGSLLYALRDIGDPEGAKAILSYAQSRTPYSDSDASHTTAFAIRVLGTLPNPIVCEPLSHIFGDDSAQSRIRLSSATTLFLSCEGEIRERAIDLILDFYLNIVNFSADQGVSYSEVLTAMTLVASNDEVAKILIDLLNNSPSDDFVPMIMESIDPSRIGFDDALVSVLNGEYVALETRVEAAKRLQDSEKTQLGEWYIVRLNELLREAELDGYPVETIESIKKIIFDLETR